MAITLLMNMQRTSLVHVDAQIGMWSRHMWKCCSAVDGVLLFLSIAVPFQTSLVQSLLQALSKCFFFHCCRQEKRCCFCGVLICSLFSIFAHVWKQVFHADLNEKAFINLRAAWFAFRFWSSSVDCKSLSRVSQRRHSCQSQAVEF